MTTLQAYIAGLQNGRLCRKYSNQKTPKPTTAQWTGAYLDPIDREGLGALGDAVALAEYIRGCEEGWRHASGASQSV